MTELFYLSSINVNAISILKMSNEGKSRRSVIETVRGSEVRIGWLHVNIKLFLRQRLCFFLFVPTFYFYPNIAAK